MNPPVVKKVPIERTHHGDTFIDNYEWLRDKENPEVIAHLEAENAFTESQLAGQAGLRDAIFDEIKARTKETDLSVPTRSGGYWYYSRTIEGKQYPQFCRCAVQGDDWTPPSLDAELTVEGEEVVLDCNELADGHAFFSLGAFTTSVDGSLLAYSFDVRGDERYTLRIKNLTSGETRPDEIDDTAPGVTWAADNEHIFYQTVDEAWRPDTVWRHRLGTAKADDVKVFHEPDERYWVGAHSTRSEKYLIISVGSKITTESWILESDNPTGEFRLVIGRQEGVEYHLAHAVLGGVDSLVLTHNGLDGTVVENFEVAVAPVSDPTSRRVLLAHAEDTRVEDVDAFSSHLVLSFRRDALPRVAVWPVTADGVGELVEIDFGLELFAATVGSNPEWEQPVLRLGVASFITPSRVYDYAFDSGELFLRKEQPVLGGFDAADYVQQRAWATAADGTQIPLSVVAHKDTAFPAPTMIYGYGSYEASMDPGFSVARLSLLDRGIVFVVAHVRGGGEMGRHWYENGKTLTKKNTFTDFVDSARYLVESRVASRLVASGGSAGGLLMGAVANLAPELFAGVVADVPFVDPLTSILDPSLPLTVIEWDEWGNPLADEEVYRYMKSYSPYENVKPKEYPQILAITSLNDTRVLYVEPAKWVAKLREVGAPALLRCEMSAGHGGVSGRYEKWKEVAFEFAWVISVATGQ